MIFIIIIIIIIITIIIIISWCYFKNKCFFVQFNREIDKKKNKPLKQILFVIWGIPFLVENQSSLVENPLHVLGASSARNVQFLAKKLFC